MSLKVVIPTPLRKFTSGAETVEVEAATVKEVSTIRIRDTRVFGPVYATNRGLSAGSSIYISMGRTFGFSKTFQLR